MRRFWLLRCFFAVVVVTTLLGCSTHHTTLDSAGSVATIYALSEDDALQVAQRALLQVFPGNSISGISGPNPGYRTTYRMALDTYSQQVVAIPAIGLDPAGREVRGYIFEVSGSGSAVISGRMKNDELFETLQLLLQQSKSGAKVSGLRTGTAGTQPATVPPADRGDGSVAQRLRTLQSLRDQGLISEEEFRAKRLKILEDL